MKRSLLKILFTAFTLYFCITPQTAFSEQVTKISNTLGDLKLANYKGSVLYVHYWSSTNCPNCIQQLLWLNKMQSLYGIDGLKIISINSDQSSEYLNNISNQNKLLFDIINKPDTKMGRKDVNGLKIYNRNGSLVLEGSLKKHNDKKAVERKIQHLLGYYNIASR